MQQKNIFLMLALSGSVLMMMLVSVLFFVPTPTSLRADISRADIAVAEPRAVFQNLSKKVSENVYVSTRSEDEILKTIQSYVAGNDPDTAKKLYDELYTVKKARALPMGGEAEMLVAR